METAIVNCETHTLSQVSASLEICYECGTFFSEGNALTTDQVLEDVATLESAIFEVSDTLDGLSQRPKVATIYLKYASEILTRPTMDTEFGILLLRAERAIFNHYPAQQGKQLLESDSKSRLPKNLLPQIRKANRHIDDDELEDFIYELRRKGQRWTRAAQIEWADALRLSKGVKRSKPVAQTRETADTDTAPASASETRETADTAPAPVQQVSIADEIESIAAIDTVPAPLPEFEPVDSGMLTRTEAVGILREYIKGIESVKHQFAMVSLRLEIEMWQPERQNQEEE